MIKIRIGQAPAMFTCNVFSKRFQASYLDPAYLAESPALDRLENIAWLAYTEGRKAPFTQKAGAGYSDPNFLLSSEWMQPRKASTRRSYDAFDLDLLLQAEIRNVALAVAQTVAELRSGRLQAVQPTLKRPRPK